MHLTRLELAHPKALPPQGSVYTNFTTGAYVYYNIFFNYGEKNPKITHITMDAILKSPHNLDLKTPYDLRNMIFGDFLFYGVRFLKVFFTDQLIISLKRSSPETRC